VEKTRETKAAILPLTSLSTDMTVPSHTMAILGSTSVDGTEKAVMNGDAKKTTRSRSKDSSGKTRKSKSPISKRASNTSLENGGHTALHSDPNYELPDPEEMMEKLNHEVKELKLETKRLFAELVKGQEELETTKVEAKEVKKKVQSEKLKGNELIKIGHLTRLGFDEDIIKAHIEKENKKLEKDMKKKKKDVDNVQANIEKMIEMNRQCEKACTGAQGAYNQMVVNHQKLKTLLDEVELGLYAQESQNRHKKTMKSVEITNKGTFKKAMQAIIRIIKDRSHDEKLVREVLKIAGRVMSADLRIASDDDDSDSCSSYSSVSVSSASSDSS
jgi:hypothetical protein